MESKYIVTADGSRLNVRGNTSTYRVLNYIHRAGEVGRRYTDIVKYIVEEINGRKYDYSMRGYWGTNLLATKSSWRGGDRVGILTRFADKNEDGKWVLTDIVLKSHFEGITDGMAKDSITGDICWFKDGILHREDGPAIELANGTKRWFVNGKRHRADGPAVELANGKMYYFLNGNKLTKKEFDLIMIKKSGADEMDIELMNTLGLFDKTLDEDMVAPMDPGPGSPGGFFQSPESMPTSMDTYSLLGPMKPIKKAKGKKKSKKTNKVLSFKDFIGSTRK